MKSELQANAHELRRLAVSACCDPRTVARYLGGERIQSTSRARIESALQVTSRKRTRRQCGRSGNK